MIDYKTASAVQIVEAAYNAAELERPLKDCKCTADSLEIMAARVYALRMAVRELVKLRADTGCDKNPLLNW